jgi:hypothetical protein
MPGDEHDYREQRSRDFGHELPRTRARRLRDSTTSGCGGSWLIREPPTKRCTRSRALSAQRGLQTREIMDVYADAAYRLRPVLWDFLRDFSAPLCALILWLTWLVTVRVRQEERKLREFLRRAAASMGSDEPHAGAIRSDSKK